MFKPVTSYPIVDGVEVRTMGPCLRALRLVFKRKADVKRSRFSIEEESMFLVDTEGGASGEGGELVPHVVSLTLDHKTTPGIFGGRLVRKTSDHIETEDGDPFKQGYARVVKAGNPERLVSEPIMVFSVDVLDEAAYGAAHAAATDVYNKEFPAIVGDDWS
jgi:hypothetical protein